ncbi:unnamed protein product, partial [Adineta steineri]
METAS